MSERDHVPAELIAAVIHHCALAGCTCTPFVDVLELVTDTTDDNAEPVAQVIEISHAPECSTNRRTAKAWN